MAERTARWESEARGRTVPPPLVAPFLHRPHLERILDDALSRRLVAVVADAGFGKSTLLASWASAHPTAWYTVTAADAEIGVFAAGLVDALSVRVPALAASVRGLVAAGRGPDADADRPARAAAHAAVLADALDRHIVRDLALVIDDLSEITSQDPAARFVEALTRMAPSKLHIVLASRTAIPFPIERLRGQGQVLAIDGALLAFSLDETAELLASQLGEEDDELAKLLHGATGGWPAGVRLATEALRSTPASERTESLGRILKPGGPVAAYLLDEALARSAPEIRQLLTTVAPLDHFSPGVCGALGVADADRLLPEIAGRGLFVQTLDDGRTFALTPMVRELLTIDTSGERRARSVQRRAATWHLRHAEWRDALVCLTAAADPRLATFLEERGSSLLAAGEVDAILAAVSRVPAAKRSPAIDRLEGEARQVRGDWDGALRCFERIASARGPMTAAVSWRMGLIHHLRGELDRSIDAYRRGRGDRSSLRDAALLHAWWASALWLRGDVDGCRDLAARALADAQASGDDSALAAAHTVLAMVAAMDSDRRANDAHYLRALEHATRANDILQAIRIRANRGSRFAEEGYYAEALTELDEAIRLADLAGFAAFRALALANRGQVLLALGRLDEAITELEAARALYQRMESRLVAYPLTHLGEVYRERGDMALARANFEEALAVSETTGDMQGLVPALSGLARVLVRSEPKRATALAARAVDAGPVLGRAAALLAAGWVALANDDLDLARRRAEEAASLARARRDRASLAGAIELAVRSSSNPVSERDRLDEALALWRDLDSPIGVARVELALAELLPADDAVPVAIRARSASRRIGARRVAQNADRLLDELAAQPLAAVEIRSLGGFEVLRRGRTVPLSEWRSRKARGILKVLVSARGARVVREQLMDQFWPNEDPERSGPRLSVALSTIRAVLDPERREPGDRYLGTDRTSAWLNVDQLPVDVEHFLARADEGLRLVASGAVAARAELAETEASYRGDFLGEDSYEDWAVPTREEARATYLRVARALADLAAADGDHAAAAGYLRRIIERDQWDEAAHLGLVAALEAGGQHGEARRAYRAYAARMHELDVEAAPFPRSPGPRSP
jgi:ATP/maltotriose-dependent transcriptional regulator MalT/DNA-binding SARP family transcriptional activator